MAHSGTHVRVMAAMRRAWCQGATGRKLQSTGQVGVRAAVGVVPCGGQRGQFPDGVDVAGPAVPHFIAAVVLARHGIGPPPQLGELGAEGLPVKADPVRRDGTAGRGGVQGVGDGLGEFFRQSRR